MTITWKSTVKLNTDSICFGHLANYVRSLQENLARSAANQSARTIVAHIIMSDLKYITPDNARYSLNVNRGSTFCFYRFFFYGEPVILSVVLRLTLACLVMSLLQCLSGENALIVLFMCIS